MVITEMDIFPQVAEVKVEIVVIKMKLRLMVVLMNIRIEVITSALHPDLHCHCELHCNVEPNAYFCFINRCKNPFSFTHLLASKELLSELYRENHPLQTCLLLIFTLRMLRLTGNFALFTAKN